MQKASVQTVQVIWFRAHMHVVLQIVVDYSIPSAILALHSISKQMLPQEYDTIRQPGV